MARFIAPRRSLSANLSRRRQSLRKGKQHNRQRHAQFFRVCCFTESELTNHAALSMLSEQDGDA